MRLRGGYSPKIAGRPSSMVRDVPVPDRLSIDLCQSGIAYTPAVSRDQRVAFGEALATAEITGGRIALPSPAAGVVSLAVGDDGVPGSILLNVTGKHVEAAMGQLRQPERTTAEDIRAALARGGIWPLFWSSKCGGIPPLDGSEQPQHVLVNCVAAEPFKPRGKIILRDGWARVLAGIQFLPRLLRECGTVHLMLTDPSDPVAEMIRAETTGKAWVRIESVPLRYPIENPAILYRSLKQSDKRIARDAIIWVVDVQTAEAIGACLGNGIPLHQRVLAVGGPGAVNPCHLRARVGTGLDTVLKPSECGEDRWVLRGGLFQGERINPATARVAYGDDAFFVLPRPSHREFLSFMRPGFDRVSMLPCFASRLTGAVDRHITTSLRGERRPCIACGLCEEVCPVALMPQVLHRYLYSESFDEAEEAGLSLCVNCGLCTYVCPSKLELQQQFAEARTRLQQEHAQAEAARRQADQEP